MPRNRRQRGKITGTEDVDFITCRICGDRRRVISRRHLSKHDTDRLAYTEEYDLSPDQLIAKAFRVLQSRDPDFKANGKAEWVAEIKQIYKRKGLAGLRSLQKNHFHLYLPNATEPSPVLIRWGFAAKRFSGTTCAGLGLATRNVWTLRSFIPRHQSRLESLRRLLVSDALQHRARPSQEVPVIIRNNGRQRGEGDEMGTGAVVAPDRAWASGGLTLDLNPARKASIQASRTEKTLPRAKSIYR